VSLRFRLYGDSEHAFSEAIGTVMGVTPAEGPADTVSVINRRGQATQVRIRDITAGKTWLDA
jgi:hypothetical protein